MSCECRQKVAEWLHRAYAIHDGQPRVSYYVLELSTVGGFMLATDTAVQRIAYGVGAPDLSSWLGLGLYLMYAVWFGFALLVPRFSGGGQTTKWHFSGFQRVLVFVGLLLSIGGVAYVWRLGSTPAQDLFRMPHLEGRLIDVEVEYAKRIRGNATGLPWVEFAFSLDIGEKPYRPPLIVFAKAHPGYADELLFGLIYVKHRGEYITKGVFSSGEISGATETAVILSKEAQTGRLTFIVRVRPKDTSDEAMYHALMADPKRFTLIGVRGL